MGIFSFIEDAFKEVGNAFKTGINFVGDKVLKPGINFVGDKVLKPTIGFVAKDVLKPTISTGLNVVNTGVNVIGKGAEVVIDKGGKIIDKGIDILDRGASATIDAWGGMMKTLTSPFGLLGIAIVGLAVIMLLKR